jgi:hypothetical protein
VPVGTRIWWIFVAPSGTQIAGYRIQYSGYARRFNGRNQGVVQAVSSAAGVVVSREGVGAFAPAWLAGAGAHEQWIQVLAQCDGPIGAPDCPPNVAHAYFDIRQADLTLTDNSPPTTGAPSGSAVSSTVWDGEETVTFPASDVGGGLHKWLLYLDGSLMTAQTLDTWGGRCVDRGSGTHVSRRLSRARRRSTRRSR